jgi:uncharacterized protein YrrD
MDVKSLKGIAIVSIEQGEKVGSVDNVLLNLETKRVIAYKLIKPGLLRSGGIVLKHEDVESIGKDAVMIRNRERIRELKEERDLQSRPDLAALSALRVVTQDGTYIGNLATAQFDPKTGNLTHIEVSGGGLMDKLRRNKVIGIEEVVSMGTDVVVVPDSHAPATVEPEAADTEPTEDTEQKRGEILQ